MFSPASLSPSENPFSSPNPEGIYVLHAFEKKTQKTSAQDLRIGRDRFRALKNLGQQHGKEKRG